MNPSFLLWLFIIGAVQLSLFGSSLADEANDKMSIYKEPDKVDCGFHDISCNAMYEVCNYKSRECAEVFKTDDNMTYITAVCCEALQIGNRGNSSKVDLWDVCQYRSSKENITCTKEEGSTTKEQTQTTTRTETNQSPEIPSTDSKWTAGTIATIIEAIFLGLIFLTLVIVICLKWTPLKNWETSRCPRLDCLKKVINTTDVPLLGAGRGRSDVENSSDPPLLKKPGGSKDHETQTEVESLQKDTGGVLNSNPEGGASLRTFIRADIQRDDAFQENNGDSGSSDYDDIDKKRASRKSQLNTMI